MVVLGVFLHALGGFAAGSFYIPFKKVRNWAWESYWLVGGFFSWIIVPLVVALLTVPGLFSILGEAPLKSVLLCYLFGLLWGIGGLTFGPVHEWKGSGRRTHLIVFTGIFVLILSTVVVGFGNYLAALGK